MIVSFATATLRRGRLLKIENHPIHEWNAISSELDDELLEHIIVKNYWSEIRNSLDMLDYFWFVHR